MSFHVFSAVVLMACAMAMKRFPIKRKPASFHLILLAALALLISPQHMIGIVWGGAVQKFAQDVW